MVIIGGKSVWQRVDTTLVKSANANWPPTGSDETVTSDLGLMLLQRIVGSN